MISAHFHAIQYHRRQLKQVAPCFVVHAGITHWTAMLWNLALVERLACMLACAPWVARMLRVSQFATSLLTPQVQFYSQCVDHTGLLTAAPATAISAILGSNARSRDAAFSALQLHAIHRLVLHMGTAV